MSYTNMDKAMKRLKSTLLTELDGRWYYQHQLYTGILFFDKENYLIEVFEVADGVITKLYTPICQYKPISYPQIDCSDFWNIDEDDYGCGMIPQRYMGEPYHGISYTFFNGICKSETYTDEKGQTFNSILWYENKEDPYEFELNYANYESGSYVYTECFSLEESTDSGSFSYRKYDERDSNKRLKHIFVSNNFRTDRVTGFGAAGNEIQEKDYLKCPFSLPKYFELLENYKTLKMNSNWFRIWLSDDINESLVREWILNKSLAETESILVLDIEHLDTLIFFNDKINLPYLKRLELKNSQLAGKDTFDQKEMDKVNALKATHPHFEVVIN